MSSRDVDQRLDAIRKVLDEHLDPPMASKALKEWIGSGADFLPGSVISFVKTIGQRFDIPAHRRNALRLALYRALSKNRPASVAAVRAPRDRSLGVEQLVFLGLTEYIVTASMRRGGMVQADFLAASHESLGRLPFDRPLQNNLRDWLNQRADMDIAKIPTRMFRDLLNALYVALCEAVGPSAADALLRQAVEEMESTPEGQQCTPRAFL